MRTLRLHLPLASSGLAIVQLIQAALVGASLLFFSGIGWLWWETQEVEAEIREYEEGVSQVMETSRQFRQQAEANGYNLSDQWIQALPQHVAFSNQLASQQKFSWTQFLNDLETAVPPRISMDAVVLDFQHSKIMLSGAALTLDDLSALVNGLERHPAFQQIVLANHKIQKKDDKKRKFSFFAFNLEVTYQPEGQTPSRQGAR